MFRLSYNIFYVLKKDTRMGGSRVQPSWQRLSEHAGLSEYEAKVYMSLVMMGATKARKVSTRCGVPRTKVYGTLKKLMERGLVIEIPGQPRKFAPISPAVAFEAYLQSLQRKSQDLSEVVSFLEDAFRKTDVTIKPEREEIWILRGRSEILRRVQEMLSGAEESVDVVTTEKGLILFYKAVNKLLDKLEVKGVKVRIVAPFGPYNGSLAQELNYMCDVKHMNVGFPVLFLCVDNREFLLAEPTPDDFNTDSGRDVGVFSNNSILCGLISLLLQGRQRMLKNLAEYR